MLEFLNPQKSPDEWTLIHKNMNDSSWDNFTLERTGDLTVWLTKHNPIKFREWNRIARDLRPIVKSHVAGLRTQQAIGEDLASFLEWDFIHILIESHYQELKGAPLFHLQYVLPEYRHNRVPCAWQGSYPTGQILSM